MKQNATILCLAHGTKMGGNILGNIQISISRSLYIHYAASVYVQERDPEWKEVAMGGVSIQSWAPGIGQVENDGCVHRLEVHRARRGVNKRGGSICHHTVT